MLAEPQKLIGCHVFTLDRSLGSALVLALWGLEQGGWHLLLAQRTIRNVGTWLEWPAVAEVQRGQGGSFPSHHLV